MYILIGQLFKTGKTKQLAYGFETLQDAKKMQTRYELNNWFELQIIRLS